MSITLTQTTEVPVGEAPSVLLTPGEEERRLRSYLWQRLVIDLPDARVQDWAGEFARKSDDPETTALLRHGDVDVQRAGVVVHMARTQLDTYKSLSAALQRQNECREAHEREQAARRQEELLEQLAYNPPPVPKGRDLRTVVKTVEVEAEVSAEEAEAQRRVFRGSVNRSGHWDRLSAVLAETDNSWVVERLQKRLKPNASPTAIQGVVSALKIAGGKLRALQEADAKTKAALSPRKEKPKGRKPLTQAAKA